MPKESELWDFIIANEIATEAECRLVTDINGYSVESLNDIIYCRTEYHDIEQLYACEGGSYDFSMVDTSSWKDDEEEEEEDKVL